MKLNILIIGINLGFIAALISLLMSISHIDRLEKEQEVINRLVNSYSKVLNTSSQLYTRVLEDAAPLFFTSLESLRLSMEDFTRIEAIIEIDESLYQAFEIIGNLNQLQEERLKRTSEAVERLLNGFAEITGFQFPFIPADIPLVAFATRTVRYGELLLLRQDLENSINALDLNESIDQLGIQSELIHYQIGARRKQALLVSFSIALIIVSVSFIAGMMVNRSIRSPLLRIKEDVRSISSGNLNRVISVRGNDEITKLASDLKSFATNLKRSISLIQNLAGENRSINSDINSTANDASQVIEEISIEMAAISAQSEELCESIELAHEALRDIRVVIANEDALITEQTVMVEQSTAAVTRMIAAIRSVAQRIEENSVSALHLARVTQLGATRLRETSDNVITLNKRIESIQEMADLIKTISEQTNLLSMNAAIEAAHAGESGRGFAVVAAEIRKLAEASGRSSSSISSSINSIISLIAMTAESAETTTEAFVAIGRGVQEAQDSHSIIAQSARELEHGGGQILEAMQRLRGVSNSVTEGLSQIRNAESEVAKTIARYNQQIEANEQSIRKVRKGTDLMQKQINFSVQLGNKVRSVSNSLEDAIDYFNLE
jgi:methyl-accepting chemotaxis protein